jgi:hypothetical protein
MQAKGRVKLAAAAGGAAAQHLPRRLVLLRARNTLNFVSFTLCVESTGLMGGESAPGVGAVRG